MTSESGDCYSERGTHNHQTGGSMSDEFHRPRERRERDAGPERRSSRFREAPGEVEADTMSADLLKSGGPSSTGMAASLKAADGATRARAIGQLQRERGNAYVQRVVAALRGTSEHLIDLPGPQSTVQRQAPPASTPALAPPGPERVVTAHGVFDVYADDAQMSLAPAARSATVIPIKRTQFDRLQTAIEAISGGGAGIRIVGTSALKASVLSDLAWLCSQSVGVELVEAIVASGKNLTIQATGGGNTTSYNPDADSWPKADGSPGAGANATISYNTAELNPYGGTEVWMTRPPAIGLAHEMVHAWTAMIGTRAPGETGGVRNRELQATGLGAYAGAVYTENRFRAAFGLPERPRY
jgi:NleD-like pathogen effector protein (putative zinc metallopeptidase)